LQNYDFDNIDDWEIIGDKESFLMTRRLLKEEGIYAGGSAGAAICGAIKYAKKLDKPEKILVLLHDSGNRYASKIYNDDWMSDNGYLDSSFDVQIKDVLSALKKTGDLISITDQATIGEAISLMDEKGISQLPCMDSQGTIKGLVSEKSLLKPVMMGEFSKEDNISLAFNMNYKMVNQNDLLSNVADALLQKEIALVTDEGKIINILTDIDVLQYISQTRAY
jgi:cystathionine beta-synthase